MRREPRRGGGCVPARLHTGRVRVGLGCAGRVITWWALHPVGLSSGRRNRPGGRPDIAAIPNSVTENAAGQNRSGQVTYWPAGLCQCRVPP